MAEGVPAGDLARLHQQLRCKIGGRTKRDSVGGKGVGQRAEQRVVFVVAFVRDEVVIKSFDALPVGPMAQPHARLVEQRLVKLAGHRGLLDAVAAEVTNRAAQPAPAEPFEILADAGERGVGQVGSADAANVIVLPAKCFGHEHGIPSPGGEQANAFGGAHAACSDSLED